MKKFFIYTTLCSTIFLALSFTIKKNPPKALEQKFTINRLINAPLLTLEKALSKYSCNLQTANADFQSEHGDKDAGHRIWPDQSHSMGFTKFLGRGKHTTSYGSIIRSPRPPQYRLILTAGPANFHQSVNNALK